MTDYVLSEKTLKALRDAEKNHHFMSLGFSASEFGSFKKEYGIRDDDFYVEISLDTTSGEFKVIREDIKGNEYTVDKESRLYRSLFEMVDMDALENRHVFQVNVPEDLFKEMESHHIPMEECMDTSEQDALFELASDINMFFKCSRELVRISSEVAANENSSDNLQKVYEGLRDYVNSYQLVLSNAMDIYRRISNELADENVLYLGNSLEETQYIHSRLKVIIHTKSLYNSILDNYNDFLEKATGNGGSVSKGQSASIADSVNRCFVYINRFRAFHPVLVELCNKILYDDERS